MNNLQSAGIKLTHILFLNFKICRHLMKNKTFRQIKREIRILGIDDAPFLPHHQGEALLVGTIFRGGSWMDGVITTHLQVDGQDATSKIISMVNKSRHRGQLGVMMLDGITFGGFNVADIKEIFEKTGVPVIAVMRKTPDFDKIKKALDNFPDGKQKWEIIQKAGPIYPVKSKETIYMQINGMGVDDALKIVKLSTTHSALPEPVRTAHLIAAGVKEGESKGRA